MTVERVTGQDYTVEYNKGTQSVSFIGTIRLQTTEEYEPILQMLHKAHDATEPNEMLCLDFLQLRFLNSSGINTISRFVIFARKQDKISLTALGNRDIYWQQKSLSNLQRLWSKVHIKMQ
jgi:hypothetical protein